jgi:hypothetical protein
MLNFAIIVLMLALGASMFRGRPKRPVSSCGHRHACDCFDRRAGHHPAHA